MNQTDLSAASSRTLHCTIALVEDDASIREAQEKWLRELGHAVEVFGSGEALLDSAPLARFDLFVLDWGLPGIQGIAVLRELRVTRNLPAPVIFCTSREAEKDVVDALAAGADDFIVKPIRRAELAARVTAAIRRSYPPQQQTGHLEFGPYRFDLVARAISKGGQPVELQNREYELALLLFRNVNGVVPRERIIHELWGNVPLDGSRSLDTHASRLRRKLGLTAEAGYTLQSVYGRGYRLQAVNGTGSP
ncbi:MAG: response regulator transcription factor [Betaproteobacteria bacterium]|nr:response regulator transcription factor [Betaproteobacteria bacterium]